MPVAGSFVARTVLPFRERTCPSLPTQRRKFPEAISSFEKVFCPENEFVPERVGSVFVAIVVAAPPESKAANVLAVPVCPEVDQSSVSRPLWSVGEYPLIVPIPARVHVM